MRRYLPFIGMALGTIIAITYASMLRAHEWYPSICCNDKDCAPLPIEAIQHVPGGYYIKHLKVTIPYSDANSSPDSEYHICTRQDYVDGTPYQTIRRLAYPQGPQMNRSTLCFFAPDGGA